MIAPHANIFTQRVALAEKPPRHFRPDEADVTPVLVVEVAEVTALGHLDVRQLDCVGRDALNANPVERRVAVLDGLRSAVLRPDVFGQRNAFAQRREVFNSQVRILTKRFEEFLEIAEPRRAGLLDSEDARPERRDLLAYVNVGPFDHRGDGRHYGHAYDDAQQGEERSELVREYRGDGDLGGFNVLVHA